MNSQLVILVHNRKITNKQKGGGHAPWASWLVLLRMEQIMFKIISKIHNRNLLQVCNIIGKQDMKNCVFQSTSNENLFYQHSSYHNYTLTLIMLLVMRMNFAWKMHGSKNHKRSCLNSKRKNIKLHHCVHNKKLT